MPVTVKVNGVFNSVVHKGSNGVSIATLPDVCKTPSPGGPVPIPYPNISQAAMLAKGTTTVKADGGMMIAVKGSEFSLSNGDNAGVAGGVVSSTFMKESAWILYSFDVKMDGQNACRFMDKKFQNHQNTVDLAGEVQPPSVVPPGTAGEPKPAECKELAKKEVTDHEAAAKRAGMRKDDYDAIRGFSEQGKVTVSFRQTNPNGIANIGKYPCKPMTCKQDTNPATGLTTGKPTYTGDYDMHDLIANGATVTEPWKQGLIRSYLNQAMKDGDKFPRIMHGPQSTYASYLSAHPEQVTDRARKYLKSGATPEKPVTVFDEGKVYQLESEEDVLNLYRCKSAKPPKNWKLERKAT
jgi:hypothetical protein